MSSPGQEATDSNEARPPSRSERRSERRERAKRRMAKHGGSLRRVYRDAIARRAAGGAKPPLRRRWRRRKS